LLKYCFLKVAVVQKLLFSVVYWKRKTNYAIPATFTHLKFISLFVRKWT